VYGKELREEVGETPKIPLNPNRKMMSREKRYISIYTKSQESRKTRYTSVIYQTDTGLDCLTSRRRRLPSFFTLPDFSCAFHARIHLIASAIKEATLLFNDVHDNSLKSGHEKK
jgi:hypothetical protein